MTPERMEIARRLVACPKWMWLPGMLARVEHRGLGRVVEVDADRVNVASFWFTTKSVFPDLEDDITRLGLLAVVRRAWGRSAWVREDEEGGFICESLCKSPALTSMERFGAGPTEEAALLAALEACT